AELLGIPPTYWPARASLQAYAGLFQTRPFAAYMLNSLLVASATTALCTALAAPAAYALARLRLPGGALAAGAVVGVSLFPPTVLVVPLKQLMQSLSLVNTRTALVLAYSALNLP